MEKIDKITKLEEILKNLKEKNVNIYFFTIDTKGAASASVAHMYETAKILGDLGYKAHLLYDKAEYTGVDGWLGEDYAKLSHKITDNLNIEASDIIVIPEVFPTVMQQLSKFPCRKVVLSQAYTHIFELLPIGKTWNYDYKFFDVITTTDAQAEYIKNHFPQMNTHIIAPAISGEFTPATEPVQPVIGIMARKQTDILNIIKSFYLQFPMYKWITFKDLRGLSRKDFANQVKNTCLSVWVDDVSSFGTFPLESMECNVPVMGLIPDMVPEWMVDNSDEEKGPSIMNNGFWTDNVLNIPTMISEYLNLFMTDRIPQVIFDDMERTKGQYTLERHKASTAEVFDKLIQESIEDFNNAIENEKQNKEDE